MILPYLERSRKVKFFLLDDKEVVAEVEVPAAKPGERQKDRSEEPKPTAEHIASAFQRGQGFGKSIVARWERRP